jgi:hypothetical protein
MIMKTDKNYRMPKPVKMMAANFIDPQKRNAFKRSMIRAHLFEVATRSNGKREKD